MQKVCVSELKLCSFAKKKEDTSGWEANRSVDYCLPCAGAAASAGQNKFCSRNCHPSDDIEPAALENESLNEERSNSIQRVCELANVKTIQARMTTAMMLNIFTFH